MQEQFHKKLSISFQQRPNDSQKQNYVSSNSQNLSQYHNFMPNQSQLSSDKSAEQLLIQRWLLSWFKQNRFQRKLMFSHKEIVMYSFSFASERISIINIKGKNPFLKYCQSKTGNYGKIYYFTFLNETVALKIFQMKEFDIDDLISKALDEYIILKMCSILGCAPLLNKYFGFDLIAYDDSVMFAMEKCTQLQKISQWQINQLKHNLRLMHKYRIIHFDIKPDNIMFSPYLLKPVFIDFGFSKIIRENIGEKTLINFRGTPAFCSKQMNSLLGLQRFDYVDAYFNDIFGLKISINLMKEELQLIQPSISNLSHFQQQKIVQDSEIQNNLTVALLKYRLLLNQSTGIVQLLQRNGCFILKNYGNQLFNFIHKFVSFCLFQQIYNQLHKQFHTFIQPKIIQNYFKHYYRVFGNWDKPVQEKTIKSIQNIEQYQKQNSFNKYKQFLEIQNIYINPQYQQKSKFILIQCLRFDRKNNTLLQKMQLSKKFNLAFALQSQPNINRIKKTFEFLFKYCLCIPRTEWKRKNIFIILTQMMMLDISLLHHYEQLITFLTETNKSFYDQIHCSIQLYKLTRLQYFKHINDNYTQKDVINKLFKFAQYLLVESILKNVDSKDSQIEFIAIRLRQFFVYQTQQKEFGKYLRLVSDFNKIKNRQFKKQLLQFLYFEQLNRYNNRQLGYEVIYEYCCYIRYYTSYDIFQLQTQGFHYSIYYIYRLLIGLKKYRQLNKMLQNIIEQINCEQISQRFKFEMNIFVHSNEIDAVKIDRFLRELVYWNKSNNYWVESLDEQFQLLCYKLNLIQQGHQNNQFYNTTDLRQLYIQINYYINSTKQTIPAYFIHKLMYHYYLLSSLSQYQYCIFQPILLSFITELEQKLSTQPQNRIINRFSLYLHKLIYYREQKAYEKQISSLQKLHQLALQFDNKQIQINFIKKIIFKSIPLNKEFHTLKYSYLLYNTVNAYQLFDKYFEGPDSQIILITLYQFFMNKDYDSFYNFLIKLAEFITKFPDQRHYLNWHSSIQTLLKISEELLSMMKYQALKQKTQQIYWNKRYIVYYFIYSIQIEENQHKKSVIFYKLVKEIDYISIYAKEIILQKSLIHIIPTFKSCERKLKYLLLRWGYKYLHKQYFKKQIKKTLGNTNKTNYLRKINGLKNKIKKGFAQ